MRTTLDIAEDVLVAARARARQQGTTLGAAVSQLARLGLTGDPPAGPPTPHGLVLLPADPTHVVTDRMVHDALADE